VAEIDGVVKVPLVPSAAPPEAAAYQVIVPSVAVADKATVPVPQRVPEVDPVILGVTFTVAATAVLDAVAQPLMVAST
jgi:hypothetical protein